MNIHGRVYTMSNIDKKTANSYYNFSLVNIKV